MNPKHLLLLHDDTFLTRFYRSKLEASGWEVESAPSVPEGLDCLSAAKTDLIVVDPLLAREDVQEAFSGMQGKAGEVPILALPTVHYPLAQEISRVKGTRLLTSDSNPLGEMLKVASETLGLERQDGPLLMLATMPDEDWKQQALSAAQESLCRMRHDVLQLVRGGDNAMTLRALLHSVHHFAGQTSLLNRTALNHLGRAIEQLVYTALRAPERLDQGSVRTLGQAVDFLASLLNTQSLAGVPDFENARVVIIEDEAPAQDLIMAAMDVVGLGSAGADTPRKGLDLLDQHECDLIFLDINLPEMNGFELCNKVREIPLHERTPIVFITGMATFQNRVQSSLSGGNDFVGKPFNVAELGVKALIWVLKGRMGLQ
jgi:DNA-binding response OmpR family regulator